MPASRSRTSVALRKPSSRCRASWLVRLVSGRFVEGPTMPVMTTTALEVDDELQNRCIVLTADEDREQTRAIHQRQRKAQTIDGLLSTREANEIHRLQQNVQRLIQPILVANPYAEQLTFLDAKTRTRRDHMKYLTLIRTIVLLHQYQRPHKTRVLASGERVQYIEVIPSDIALANELAHEVLGRSLDELAPQTQARWVHDDDGAHRMQETAARAERILFYAARDSRYDRVARSPGQAPPAQARGDGVRARASRRPRSELRLRAAVSRRRRRGQAVPHGSDRHQRASKRDHDR